jgi:hypothetical protein
MLLKRLNKQGREPGKQYRLLPTPSRLNARAHKKYTHDIQHPFMYTSTQGSGAFIDTILSTASQALVSNKFAVGVSHDNLADRKYREQPQKAKKRSNAPQPRKSLKVNKRAATAQLTAAQEPRSV